MYDLTITSWSIHQILRLRNGKEIRQGRGDYLSVAERQVDHLIVRQMIVGDGEDGLSGNS